MPMPIAVAKESGHRTKQEFAYQTLRDAIMRCELQPSERLVIDDIARRLNVSIIPVREAIQILQSEGLVVTVPHAGATVAPISRQSIQDVFTVLEGLEVVATRLVAERRNTSELNALGNLVADMDKAVESKRYAQWAGLNTEFHLMIGALPGLPMLREMTERVLARWGRIRRFYFRGVLVARAEQAQQEHRDILESMRVRDLGKLEKLVRQHNRGALESYMNYLDGQTEHAAAHRR
jgi:DNA-binding GntR family transcriptional regulator